MSMWRQYIVLRDRSGHSAQGFVKLFFTHQSCNISASMTRMPRGTYQLYVWDGKQLESWPMHAVGPDQRLQIKHPLQNGRIEAAVVEQGGRLVALGESDDPRADWVAMQARIQGPTRAKPARQEDAPDIAMRSKPAPAAPAPDEKTVEKTPAPATAMEPQSAETGAQENETPENAQTAEVETPCADEAPEAQTTPAAQTNTAAPWRWQAEAEDSATWRQAHGEDLGGPAQPMPRTPRPEQSELPLIERLLQQAHPLQEEQEESVPVDEIARIIQQELEKNRKREGAPPIVIGADIEALVEQVTGAAAVPQGAQLETEQSRAAGDETTAQQPEPMDQEQTQACPEDTPESEVVLEDEGDGEITAEIEPTAAPAPEMVAAPKEEEQRPAEQEPAPPSAPRQQAMGEDDPAPPRGPMLGGEYAGQWCWKRVDATGAQGYYLLGCVVRGGVNVATAVAVPGAYAPQPPAYLQGFSIYRDGFWVLAQDCETGRTLAV